MTYIAKFYEIKDGATLENTIIFSAPDAKTATKLVQTIGNINQSIIILSSLSEISIEQLVTEITYID